MQHLISEDTEEASSDANACYQLRLNCWAHNLENIPLDLSSLGLARPLRGELESAVNRHDLNKRQNMQTHVRGNHDIIFMTTPHDSVT